MLLLTKKRSVIFQLLSIGTLCAFMWGTLLTHVAVAQEAVKVPSGTVVTLRTMTPLTPEQLNVGDLVILAVVSDVVVDGKVVIKAGAEARGEITSSKSRNMIGIAARIGLSVRSVTAVDGSTIPLFGTKLAEGKSKMTVSIGLSLVCCILFALMKGGDATIPAGTQIQATVAGTTSVQVSES